MTKPKGRKGRRKHERLRRENSLPRLAERHERKCFYCGEVVSFAPTADVRASRDHVQCRSAGGSDLIRNYVLACMQCNCDRGNMDFKAFCRLRGITPWKTREGLWVAR